jgi:hypothetical protein
VRGAELVVHAGDVSYARGYGYLWDAWFSLVEPYATKVDAPTAQHMIQFTAVTLL